VAEDGQGHELAGGEEVAIGFKAVAGRRKPARVVRQRLIEPGRLWYFRNAVVKRRRTEINPASRTLSHDSHQLAAHAILLRLISQHGVGNACTTEHTGALAALLGAVWCRAHPRP